MADRYQDDDEDDYGRSDGGLEKALVGAVAVIGAGAAAYFLGSKMRQRDEGDAMSDAPASTLRNKKGSDTLFSRTVTINKPRQELYAFWRDFKNLPQFMDNIEDVAELGGERSTWTIKGPAGTTIETTNRIIEDKPGELIAWESEEGAPVRNSGRIEFVDAAPGRGTMVRATISYDPPAGALGKAVAKVLQKEPEVQARRDLRRFKQLMETGEVTSSASPSGRKSESPTEQAL